MILIADCGSSKIEWCLIDAKGEVTKRFHTPGMNAVMLSCEEMTERLGKEMAPEVTNMAGDIDSVYFYGAGCISPKVCDSVATAIGKYIPGARIEVYSDLLAAARALCGHKPGIACIMGTGSNSCYYDGDKITDNVSPLGYILGDEGSGAVLGRRLVGDVLKEQLPAELCSAFLQEYQLDRLGIIERVYRQPGANKFLASLSPFLLKNIECPQVRAIVEGEFNAFFVRNIRHYGQQGPIHFVGSIAYYYRPILEDAASRNGFTVGMVLKAPMEGLIAYHTQA